jgi:hypothetical protein
MTTKITKKIVGVAVAKNGDNGSNVIQMHESIERPESLPGVTYKIDSPLAEQSFYITINDMILNAGTDHETRRPYEIFINSKNMDAFQWIVALTRMCSAVFRKGGDVTFVVRQLKSVFDPRGGYLAPGGILVPSLVAEIGTVIEKHLTSLGIIRKENFSPEMRAMLDNKRAQVGDAALKNASQCSQCSAYAVVLQSGCKTCLECGYSKCG